jgi:hypothetical protein
LLETETLLIIQSFIIARLISLILLQNAKKVSTPNEWLRIQLNGGPDLFDIIFNNIINNFFSVTTNSEQKERQNISELNVFVRESFQVLTNYCSLLLNKELSLSLKQDKLVICMDEAQVAMKLQKFFSATNTPFKIDRGTFTIVSGNHFVQIFF